MLDVEINVHYSLAKVEIALVYDAELEYPLIRILSIKWFFRLCVGL